MEWECESNNSISGAFIAINLQKDNDKSERRWGAERDRRMGVAST